MKDASIDMDAPATDGPQRAEAAPVSERARRAVAGTLLARPWFDHATLFGLKHIFFPASRLWAAADEAHGDVARFFAAVPMPVRHEHTERWAAILTGYEEARAAADAIDAAWERVFFGAAESRPQDRIAIEAARQSARHHLNGKRWALRARAGRHVPRAKLAIATPAEVEALYGGGPAAFKARAAPPATMPVVEMSRALPTAAGRDYWLRFPSPSARLGDIATARVHEPHDAENAPTIIFGHGICVEFDHWKGLLDESQALLSRGFRVIRPEAPGHGRRAKPGRFGGEPAIGEFPTGMLDSFSGALQEWAVLSHWVRSRSAAPLVFGGSSLGAMTSQLAAEHAADWPEAYRPEALFLVTHTGDMAASVLGGALSTLWASPQEIEKQGWTPERAHAYLSLVNPSGPLAMPAHHVVSILGRRDVILSYPSGRDLVQQWGVPPENAFAWDRGHFSVPTTLIRTTAPLDRLLAIVAALR